MGIVDYLEDHWTEVRASWIRWLYGNLASQQKVHMCRSGDKGNDVCMRRSAKRCSTGGRGGYASSLCVCFAKEEQCVCVAVLCGGRLCAVHHAVYVGRGKRLNPASQDKGMTQGTDSKDRDTGE